MRERAIQRVLKYTSAWTREQLENITDTQELVALSYDVENAVRHINL